MSQPSTWRKVWEDRAREGVSDFELDRGRSPRELDLENLAEAELLDFVKPDPVEAVLDAGCGTGVNLLRLQSRVQSIVGIDYALGSLCRCKEKLRSRAAQDVRLCLASIATLPLRNHTVDKVLCLSVLQYLGDDDVRQVFREFVRVLNPAGVIVLHVKNSSSLYWSTLLVAKRLKGLFGKPSQLYFLRTFGWYVKELNALARLPRRGLQLV